MQGVNVPQPRNLADKVDPPLSGQLKVYHFHVCCPLNSPYVFSCFDSLYNHFLAFNRV